MKVFLIIVLIILALFGILLVSSIKFKIYLSKDGYIVVKYLFLSLKYDVYGENKLKSAKKTDLTEKEKSSKQKQGYFKKIFNEKGILDGVVHFLEIVKLIVSKIAELSSQCKIESLLFAELLCVAFLPKILVKSIFLFIFYIFIYSFIDHTLIP